MNERHQQSIIDDPEQGGAWVSGDPSQPARPFDIGGMDEDGRFRPGTTFLQDTLYHPGSPSEQNPKPAVRDVTGAFSPETKL